MRRLSMALSVEASELVECFQWLTEKQPKSSPKKYQTVIGEMADVQYTNVFIATSQ
jgi:dCTP diphosphatase